MRHDDQATRSDEDTPIVVAHDRRTSPRTSTRVAVELRLRGFSAPLGARAVDIGPSGICVSTLSRIPVREVESVSLILGGRPLTIGAEGRWHRLDNSGAGFVAGLMFRRVDPEVSKLLRAFVFEAALVTASFLLDSDALDDESMDDALDAALLTRAANYEVGRRIYTQGSLRTRGDSLFVVERGAVVLETELAGVGRRVVARIGPGGVFAGLPLLADAPHAESAIAETALDLIEIDPFSFATLDQSRPRVGRRMMRAALRQRASMSRTPATSERPVSR